MTGCSPFYGKNYNEILNKNRKGIVNYEFKSKLKVPISEPGILLKITVFLSFYYKILLNVKRNWFIFYLFNLLAIDLMKWMMEVDPEKRPTATAALSHYWLLNHLIGIDKDSKHLHMLDNNMQEENIEMLEVRQNLANLQMKLKKLNF